MNMLPSIGRPEPLHNRSSRPSDGQIIKGKVIQLLNADEAIVEINGRAIKASIEVPLKPGTSYLFQVFREPEGFHLKMIKEISPGEINLNESADDLVRFFGLPVDGRSKALVRLFFHYNWPLNPSLLTQARRLLNFSEGDGGWDALKMMLEKKWPLNESLFKALAAAQNKQTSQTLNVLLQEMKQLNLASSAHQDLALLLENWPSLSDQDDAHALLNGLRNIGQDGSKQTALLKWLVQTFPENTGGIQKGWPEAKALLNQLRSPQDLKSVIRILGLPLDEGDLVKVMVNAPELKPLLNLSDRNWIKDIFSKTGFFYEAELRNLAKGQSVDLEAMTKSLKGVLIALEHSQEEMGDGFKQVVQQLLQQINGQQLQSIHMDRSFVQLLFTFPLRFEDGLRDVHLFWEGQRGEDGKVDHDYCKIAFQLDLPHLSETVVHILVQKRRVTVSVFNDHPLLSSLIDQYSAGLDEKLQGLGYDLVSVKQHVGSLPEAKAVFIPNAGSVDVRI